MAERYEVTRGLIWGRIGEMASASAGEIVSPEEFAPDRWAGYVRDGLVRKLDEPAPPPPAHTEVVAPVDQPQGRPHTETRVTGGPEGRTPSRHRKER